MNEIGRVIIVKTFDPESEGQETSVILNTHYSEGLPVIEALGMLAFAMHTCLDDYRRNAEEAEEEQ